MARVKRKVVGVLSVSGDEHAGYVAKAIERRGGTALRIDTDLIPESRSLSWDNGSVRFADVLLDDVRAFYLKAIHLGVPLSAPEEIDRRAFPTWQERYVAERERNAFVGSVLRGLASAERTFVNPPPIVELHFLKLHQLELLQRAGLPVPRTMATSDPDAIAAFAFRHRSVIYKPLAGGAKVHRLTPEDLERKEALRFCPVFLQEEVRGDEFRAYVLNGEPLSAFRIPTEGVVDARERIDEAVPTELDAETWSICVKAAKQLGLLFTAVDLRRTPEGRVVLLELNPTPAISFYEDPHDGQIVTRLADFLLSRA